MGQRVRGVAGYDGQQHGGLQQSRLGQGLRLGARRRGWRRLRGQAGPAAAQEKEEEKGPGGSGPGARSHDGRGAAAGAAPAVRGGRCSAPGAAGGEKGRWMMMEEEEQRCRLPNPAPPGLPPRIRRGEPSWIGSAPGWLRLAQAAHTCVSPAPVKGTKKLHLSSEV